MYDMPHTWIERLDNVNMSFKLKFAFRFNKILTKILAG